MKFTHQDIEKMQTVTRYGVIVDDGEKLFFNHTQNGGKTAVFIAKSGRKIEATKSDLQIFFGVFL